MCGEERHEELCKAATPKCVNCGKAHKSTDYQCEVYQLQVKINIVMAYDKIAFLEAKRLVLGASSNATAPVRSKENFPTLEHKEKQSMSQIVKSSTVKDNKGLNTRKYESSENNNNFTTDSPTQTQTPAPPQVSQPKDLGINQNLTDIKVKKPNNNSNNSNSNEKGNNVNFTWDLKKDPRLVETIGRLKDEINTRNNNNNNSNSNYFKAKNNMTKNNAKR
ncbi:hypothetical protein TKK_0007269 [Trichogramma kaykai]